MHWDVAVETGSQITTKAHLTSGICGTIFGMSLQPQDDLLNVLRSNLRRIEEESSQRGLTPEAMELKTLLLRRIAIIESAMENLGAIIAKNRGANET